MFVPNLVKKWDKKHLVLLFYLCLFLVEVAEVITRVENNTLQIIIKKYT